MKTGILFYYKTNVVGRIVVDHESVHRPRDEDEDIEVIPENGRAYYVECYRKPCGMDYYPEIELHSRPWADYCITDRDMPHARIVHAQCWYDEEAVFVYRVEAGYSVSVSRKSDGRARVR